MRVAPAAGLRRPLSQPRGPLTYRAYLARKAPTCGRHRSKTSSFGSASPGNLPHVSGLPREESTDMRAPVSPQLDFVALLSQPRGSHHVSGLPREESTGMRVPPQLDFVALLNQPRGPPCFGLTSRGGTGMTTDMSRVTAAAQLRRNY